MQRYDRSGYRSRRVIPLRLYAYLAVILVTLGMGVTIKVLNSRLKAHKAHETELVATLKAERENTRKANESAERYAISLENLKATRAAIPARSVRLCNAAPGVPATGAAASADDAAAGRVPQAPGPDIGARLYDLADEADRCVVTLSELQRWVRGR